MLGGSALTKLILVGSSIDFLHYWPMRFLFHNHHVENLHKTSNEHY